VSDGANPRRHHRRRPSRRSRDRDAYATDTLSTHALMRGSVFLLSRWRVLSRVIEAGTPAVRQTRFDFGTDSVTVSIKPTHGVDALYAPRRTVFDRALVDAAESAGADIRYGLSVTGLLRDESGRIIGIHGHDRAGAAFTARARMTVGADGTRSIVAREAGATTLRTGAGSGAIIYGYWSQFCVDGYEWFYRPGHSAGVIPTNAGEVCVFAGVPAHQLTRSDLRATYHRLLTTTTGGTGGRLAQARPPSRLHTWIGPARLHTTSPRTGLGTDRRRRVVPRSTEYPRDHRRPTRRRNPRPMPHTNRNIRRS
jgi:2-polyprenyl-6-methoxyphenol hydroxylase-like FAD-dependent oxidoreductase